MIRMTIALLSVALLSGCAAAGLTVASAGAGVGLATGVDHTLIGTVYKTFTVSVNELRFATLKALDRMDMKLAKDQAQAGGWAIEASAADRVIEIELERLSGKTTRMRVVANQGGWFLRDSATANEIVVQTAGSLDESHSRRAATTSASATGRSAR